MLVTSSDKEISHSVGPHGGEGGLRTQIVEELICEVVSGRITPGQKLTVQKLADRFGVSATPVREALIELSESGVVEWQVNRGAICRPFGPRQLHELYELRRILETEALRQACDHMPYDNLVALRRRTEEVLTRRTEDWLDLAYAADRELHHMIADHCQNQRLSYELHRYDTMMAAMCKSVHNAEDSLIVGLREHLEVVDALLAHEADRARMLLGQHIISTAHRIAAILFRPNSRGTRPMSTE